VPLLLDRGYLPKRIGTPFLAGCSTSNAHAVDPRRARHTLKLAPDRWWKAEGTEALQSPSTPMTILAFAWQFGAKLLDYQFID
jgi:hypothetical protein